MTLPDHIAARRAAARERRLRRRRVILGAGCSLVAGLVAASLLMVGLRPGAAARPSPVRPIRPAGHAVRPAPPVRLKGHLAALMRIGNQRIEALARLGKPVYCGGPRGREVAFTFDDGPGVYTHYALRKLRRAHQRATFFDVGRSLDGWPGWLSHELRLAAIGDHTATHADLAVLPPAQVYTEINQARVQIQRSSRQRVDLFRPPYGAISPTVLSVARRLDLLTIMWSQDSRDSLGANYAGIIRNVESALRPGAIILMHENRGQTIRALTTLLPELRRRHLRSVSLPELFATDPPSRAQLDRGWAGCGPRRTPVTRGSS